MYSRVLVTPVFYQWSFSDCKSYFLIHAILQETSTEECSSYLDCQLRLHGIPGGWGKRLYVGGVSPKWKKKALGTSELCPAPCRAWILPSPSIGCFHSTARKKFKLLDFTRRLHMYTYYSPVNDIILFWSDPLMIRFQQNGILPHPQNRDGDCEVCFSMWQNITKIILYRHTLLGSFFTSEV